MAKPEAVPKNQVCSECGLDWARHPKNATQADCIKLLKADLQNAEWRASYRPQWVVPYTERPITWRFGENIEKTTFPTIIKVSTQMEGKEIATATVKPHRITKEWVA